MAGDTRTERGDRRPTPDLADRRSNFQFTMWRVCRIPHALRKTHIFSTGDLLYYQERLRAYVYCRASFYTRGDLRLVRFYKIKYKFANMK